MINNRRTFLKGMLGTSLALPFLESFASSASKKIPMRMVCVGTTFGFAPQIFFPKGEGLNYQNSLLLKEIDKHRGDFTVFSQLDHNHGGGHGGVHTFLSGVLSRDAKNMAEGNISIDQKAAGAVGVQTRFPSMQLAPKPDQNNKLSWTAAGVAIPPASKLSSIYSALFRSIAPEEAAKAKYVYNSDISILDLVKTDAEDLKKQISKADNEKLDQYFTSLREVEKKLNMSKEWLDKPKPQVKYSLEAGADSLDFAERVPIYYDLMALALQTDSTRVITLEISDIGANLGGLPITKGYHTLTHHGKVPEFLKGLSVIEKFHIKQFSRFLDKLKVVKENNGKTLFDNTMSLLGSGMGNASSHSNRNLPLLLAGGGFKHIGHKIYPKKGKESQSACNLYVNMLQRFGLEIDKFGSSTGTLSGFGV